MEICSRNLLSAPSSSSRTFLATKSSEEGPELLGVETDDGKSRTLQAHLQPLSDEEVVARRKIHGLNEFKTSKRPSWISHLWRAFVHPFNILLLMLATTSGVLEEYRTMGIMIFMCVVSGGLRFYQEFRSHRAALSLQSLLTKTVRVVRLISGGVIKEEVIPTNEIVPGDWVLLSPGDSIPADVEIIESKDLHVSQAFLTGEAIPVEKFPKVAGQELKKSQSSTTALSTIFGKGLSSTENTEQYQSTVMLVDNNTTVRKPKRCSALRRSFRSIFGLRVDLESDPTQVNTKADLDQPNFCYMGTAVVTGTATAVVEATGSSTYFGKMAKELAKRRPVNAFQLGVRRISWIFFLTMICLVPPVLILQGQLNGDWWGALIFALSVAVGLTPEMLPMIVNTTLAKGALEMSKKKCIVKNLDAIINLGGIDVLCTDKTGTLTKSVVVLTKHINRSGMTSRLPLTLAYLNSHFQSAVSNPLDEAVNTFCEQDEELDNSTTKEMLQEYDSVYGDASATRVKDVALNFRLVNELPFDFVRRRISVLISRKEKTSELGNLLICKGAVEETISVCSKIFLDQRDGQVSESLEFSEVGIPDESLVVPLTPEVVTELKDTSENLNNEGLRVIAVAYKTLPPTQERFDLSVESDMIFAGFLAFIDPPKESTRDAIERLRKYNLKIKVLTGDSPSVCKKICEEIGLPVHGIVRSIDLLNATDAEVSDIANVGTIFAKLTPLQKADIIRALKRNGNIVGFLGDGINDAPALAEADVGISVDTGTDIAKDSADIILLEKNIGVIADGVIIGRTTYGNTLKYIVMAVSSNFGNVFSLLVASCWLRFVPMLPIHILVQNLLYDCSQIAIPWDHMDPEFLEVPHRWSMKSVIRFMVMLGPWSSVFDITTFIYMYFYYNIKTPKDNVGLFQTTWFTVGLLTQTMIVHMIRTPKIPFIQSWASKPVVGMTLLIVSIGLALPYVPYLSRWLQMVYLEPMVYPYLFGAILAYCIVAQLAKTIYIKLFHEWY